MIGLITMLAAAVVNPLPSVTEVERFAAPEAHQGVVADKHYVYAISNSEIGKYDRRTRKRVALWQGDPAQFIHMNSCSLLGARLVCAASNYPGVPMASSVEWFDVRTMRHIATRSLGPGRGSLTWLDWHDGSWWACFANYDGRGGETNRDHRSTVLVRFDRSFVEQGAWLFPEHVLDRFAPRSASGGAWGKDGRLYVTGHDRPELYVLKIPSAGSRLEYVATIMLPTPGQAIAWERGSSRRLWSIARSSNEVVASEVP
jgi:hypothetical protein